MSDANSTALKARIDTIEGGYEFFLSYAAKGYRGDDPQTGGELRRSIEEMDKALDGLGAFLSSLARERALEPIAPYDAFFDVIDGDAGCARKALQLVLAQPGMTSHCFLRKKRFHERFRRTFVFIANTDAEGRNIVEEKITPVIGRMNDQHIGPGGFDPFAQFTEF